MKIRILPIMVVGIMAATAVLSSCLGNDYEEIDYPAESSINAFSIGTLHQTFYVKSSKGEDSVYTDTVSYADVPFTIDQINRRIYNNDSLPKEVDVTRVVTSLSADNAAIYYVKSGKDTVWTSTDSLDFTNDVTFKVLAYSKLQNKFIFGEPYTVRVNVHKLNPDSLSWKHFGDKKFDSNSNITLSGQKAVYIDNNIYVFGETGTGKRIYKITVDRGNVGRWEEVTLDQNDTKINSATVFNNGIYFVSDGKLYKLGNPSTVVGSFTRLSNLISVSNGKLLAYTTDNEVVTIDAEGNEQADGISKFVDNHSLDGRLYAVSMPSSHNENLWRTVVMTNDNDGTAETDTTANVFSYISNDSKWVKYQPNYPTTCPNQGNISMISYDGKLFAYGEEFDYFYSSTDNGLNWKKETDYMIFPSEEKNGIKPLKSYLDGGSYSTVVEDNGRKGSFIWFIWKDGSMTRACLNRLMPKE